MGGALFSIKPIIVLHLRGGEIMKNQLISVVIRTLNESLHLENLLIGTLNQKLPSHLSVEIILIDSGSTDETLEIAKKHGCRIGHITREKFSFGRSLNQGCDMVLGDYIVLVSGHCIPKDNRWLIELCRPLIDGVAGYSYGGQLAGKTTRYSEKRIFSKYFPSKSQIPQEGFYCNNANAALLKTVWSQYRFNEEVTGLEDMELANRYVGDGGRVAYVSEGAVYHLHNESWRQVKRRFERESIALQQIMPQVHLNLVDVFRYVTSSIWLDMKAAKNDGILLNVLPEIVWYRLWQYWGSYCGNHEHRKLSRKQKEIYFYPS